MNKYIPLFIFFLLAPLLYFGLHNDPKKVPSPFIDKPVPQFTTNRLYVKDQISTTDMLGKVWVLNAFASWCAACRVEHRFVSELAKTHENVPIIGLNYKDQSEDAKAWLAALGNPYRAIAVDLDGKIGINFGVYGVPESFIIDKKGIVRYKQIGPITPSSLSQTINPLLEQLSKE